MMQKRSWVCLLFIIILGFESKAQTKLKGVVLDQVSNEKLGQIHIVNLGSKVEAKSDAIGQFEIAVKINELLVFSALGYRSDTVLVTSYKPLKHYLLADVNNLRTVQIQHEVDYKKQYAQVLNRANPILLKPGRGLLLYPKSLFSQEGKQARYFKRMIKAEQGELEIDRKFNRKTVTSILPLVQPELDAFMIQFRPSLAFVRRADSEDFKFYLIDSYNKFKELPLEKRKVTELKSDINN